MLLFLWDVDGGAKITKPLGVLSVEVQPQTLEPDARMTAQQKCGAVPRRARI